MIFAMIRLSLRRVARWLRAHDPRPVLAAAATGLHRFRRAFMQALLADLEGERRSAGV